MRQGLQEIAVSPLSITFYDDLVESELLDEVITLARPLRGRRIVMLNATGYGGGVAEIFKSLVPLMHSLEIKVEWYALPADADFFAVTKSLHNALQGAPYDFTPEAKQIYLNYNRKVAKELEKIKADIYEIHDPQPLALIDYAKLKHTVWRCHIDTTAPNQAVWDFLAPYIDRYDELIFTLPEYAHSDLKHTSINFITPTIDPLAVKNVLLDKAAARAIVRAFGVDITRPLVTQVSRFDPWKDPKGVIDAFRLARKQIKGLQLALVGSMAHDDPEGAEIFVELEDYAKKDPDIHLLSNLGGVGEIEVNAFQTFSDVLLQKSIREGFGLTVAEGMWKKQVVIGGNVGGIKTQIRDGETGYLVESVQDCAKRIVEVIKGSPKVDAIGQKAHEYVRHHFTHPRLIRDHLKLYHRMLGL